MYLCLLPDDGRMELPKHVGKKNELTVFRCSVCVDLNRCSYIKLDCITETTQVTEG